VDVVKTFPGVVALNHVNLDVDPGEIHALVGENGAGKSTLMAVAAGSMVPDSGSVEIGGSLLEPATPSTAQALGLAVVYQQAAILDDLTVAENMVFAMPRSGRPSFGRTAEWTRSRLAAVGLAVDPQARISELGLAERQLLEIAKALALESRVLILDEPTESLTAFECERLFERIAAIKASGASVVYISHRLPEVKRIADRITVLRDGQIRGTALAADLSESDVLGLIVGRSIDRIFPAKRPVDGPDGAPPVPFLETNGLTGSRFRDVSLSVGRGEIVGLAGIEGNGQREFLRTIAGLLPVSAGEVRLSGAVVNLDSPSAAGRQGVTHLPADRHREGVFGSLSVRENIALGALGRTTLGGLIRRDRELAVVRPQVEALEIKAASLDAPVATLSGGNQQKVLVARSLLTEPHLLLADEPTRGVDVGARVELYRILRESAGDDRAVLVVSSDALELQGLCDRVVVFSRGTIVRTLAGDEISEANITGAALTATTSRAELAGRARRSLRLQRFAGGDYAPALILAILILGLTVLSGLANGRFYNDRNITSVLLLSSAVIFVSFGQLVAILVGGFDLSVGPLTGLTVVVMSYLAVPGASAAPLGWLIALVVLAIAVGLVNGFLVQVVKLTPVIATLATYIVIQGVSLALRPQPGGLIDSDLTKLITTSVGPIPIAFLVAIAIGIVLELALRRTGWGLELRAVGSDEVRAHRLGARVRRTRLLAYVACSAFAVLGGVMLASQVHIGDASLGTAYSLTSITAVVLGGASIFGGRGSFIGAMLGAILLQEIITSSTFLGLGTAWQYWLPGILILLGAGAYSRARGFRAAALDAQTE
jgi:ribose transport system ATP-binding protein